MDTEIPRFCISYRLKYTHIICTIHITTSLDQISHLFYFNFKLKAFFMHIFGMKNIFSPYGWDVLESVFFPSNYIFTFAFLYSRHTLSSFSTKGLSRVHKLNHWNFPITFESTALIKAKSNTCNAVKFISFMTALPTVSYSYSRQVVSKDITIHKSKYSITIKIKM